MSEPFIGEMKVWPGSWEPRGWAFCDGRALPIIEFQSLYAVIGTRYGGDGRQTFCLPDLRGRVPIGGGNAPGLTPRYLGETGGAERVILGISEMPEHTHVGITKTEAEISGLDITATARCNDQASGKGLKKTTDPTGAVWRATSDAAQTVYSNDPPNADMNPLAIETNVVGGTINAASTTTIVETGGSQPHPIMQPFVTLNYIIALDGLFPSRS